MELEEILLYSRDQRASDVLIAPEMPVRMRIDGKLVSWDKGELSAETTRRFADELIGEKGWKEYEEKGDFDLAITIDNGKIRCRVNVYQCINGDCLAIRILASKIPKLEQLGLPPVVATIPKITRGLVLVTGETGSGKSTTLAAVIDEINQNNQKHIITLEDPVEYVYEPALCSIDQREVGKDTVSFAMGTRATLREDPDIILIGELRDPETIEAALIAAETGHLVFGTLHTMDASSTVSRIVSTFEGNQQMQIKAMLADTLQMVISQKLLPRKSEPGRVAAAEVMVVTPAIKNLIVEGNSQKIKNSLSTSADVGSISMDRSLLNLAQSRTIDIESAIDYAVDKEYVAQKLRF